MEQITNYIATMMADKIRRDTESILWKGEVSPKNMWSYLNEYDGRWNKLIDEMNCKIEYDSKEDQILIIYNNKTFVYDWYDDLIMSFYHYYLAYTRRNKIKDILE